MAQKTRRQHLEERLVSLADNLAAELAKAKADDEKVQDLKAAIKQTKATLEANGPELDKPHSLNWGAVTG